MTYSKNEIRYLLANKRYKMGAPRSVNTDRPLLPPPSRRPPSWRPPPSNSAPLQALPFRRPPSRHPASAAPPRLGSPTPASAAPPRLGSPPGGGGGGGGGGAHPTPRALEREPPAHSPTRPPLDLQASRCSTTPSTTRCACSSRRTDRPSPQLVESGGAPWAFLWDPSPQPPPRLPRGSAGSGGKTGLARPQPLDITPQRSLPQPPISLPATCPATYPPSPSQVAMHDAPRCDVDSGVCKMDLRVDKGKTRLLYLPGWVRTGSGLGLGSGSGLGLGSARVSSTCPAGCALG